MVVVCSFLFCHELEELKMNVWELRGGKKRAGEDRVPLVRTPSWRALPTVEYSIGL